jgi:lysophospholipase L1-like esterase
MKGAVTSKSNYFLTNLDVRGDGLRGAVVTFGASITEGFSSTNDANRRWPDDPARRLADARLGIGVLNAGISGTRLLVDGAGPSALVRFDRDVLAQHGVRWVIFSDDPINDLGSTRPSPPAYTLIAGIKRLIEQAHRKHVQFLCSTLTPFQGANYWTAEEEITREQIDSFLRSGSSGCDTVIDMDAAAHDPAHPTQYLPANDIGDPLHPNDAGQQAIANAVDLSRFLQSGAVPR